MDFVKKITFAQSVQVAVFTIFCLEFIGFSAGYIHVPTIAEDNKFFYMIFGILNTILSVPTLIKAIQRDDDKNNAPTVINNTNAKESETPNE